MQLKLENNKTSRRQQYNKINIISTVISSKIKEKVYVPVYVQCSEETAEPRATKFGRKPVYMKLCTSKPIFD